MIAALSFVYALQSIKPYPVQIYFVDLFDASKEKISALKGQGKTVICYLSAGSAENWRSDYKRYPSAAIGKPLDGWAGEAWVDYRNQAVRGVISARLDLAKSKACNGVDPDNIDGHLNKTGFPLKASDQKEFFSWLSKEAHARGLTIGLKNSAETAQAPSTLADFAVIEECFKYNECDRYKAIKTQYRIEYRAKSNDLCKKSKAAGAALVFADAALKEFQFCDVGS